MIGNALEEKGHRILYIGSAFVGVVSFVGGVVGIIVGLPKIAESLPWWLQWLSLFLLSPWMLIFVGALFATFSIWFYFDSVAGLFVNFLRPAQIFIKSTIKFFCYVFDYFGSDKSIAENNPDQLISIRDVIDYIDAESEYGLEKLPSYTNEYKAETKSINPRWEKAKHEIERAALQGQLEVYGRPHDGSSSSYLSARGKIDPAYWANHEIDLIRTFMDPGSDGGLAKDKADSSKSPSEPPKERNDPFSWLNSPARARPGLFNSPLPKEKASIHYVGLRVRRGDVESLWPRRGIPQS